MSGAYTNFYIYEPKRLLARAHISLRDIPSGQSRRVGGLEFYRISPEDTELIEHGYAAHRLVIKTKEGQVYADGGGHTRFEDDLPYSEQPHITDVIRYLRLTLLQHIAVAEFGDGNAKVSPKLSLEQSWDEVFA